ncbi:hypothetical protein [Paracholeplasma manati]|uniref:Uncharacterized protein n=1 Tax=Paracholeplasma manati TaxID=591373 RepID=A0ABT2YBQ2_9MOLU|nr:hypothetical protein [Paracholeplasma manati]MCV2232263.1 hypothetical protein [Paracholeplasma manati]MDG0888220.1 hypothetical protein [Paracholeplasma manati]
MNSVKQKESFKSSMKRWYDYNKYSIPTIFTVIGSLIYTLFLDFRTNGFVFRSHISAINELTNKEVGFYLFALYIIALVQIFNSMSFSKKRSPMSLILFTVLNLFQGLFVFLYSNAFLYEAATRADYTLKNYSIMSMGIMAAGFVFYVIATLFAWVYVDWKYVKIED